MIRHFWEALDEGPGIIYRVSGRTNIDVSDEIIQLLSRHPNFLGVKECEGRVRNLTTLFEKAAAYLSGVMFQFGNPSTVHSVAEMMREATGIRGFRNPARALIECQRSWTIKNLQRVGVRRLQDFGDNKIMNFSRLP